MSQVRDQGLCPRCRKQPQCAAARRASAPVWLCQDAALDDGSNGSVHDLCSSCERANACDLPRLDGGVWHCESYQAFEE